MENLPKTRGKAREQESKSYFTGLACKHGHVTKRWTATGNCAECQRKRTEDWTKANPEKHEAYRNSDARKESTNASFRKFYQKHKTRFIAKDAKRRALKLLATTVWGQENVESFYRHAKELEQLNPGVKYHVDHIVPLVGKNVCGLHNHFNLQILTEEENKRKGNSWD